MTVQDFVKLLRTRWVIICVTVIIAVLCAVAVNLLTTPLYEASTRLFVSTTSGANLTETYQGNRFSQERVVSYTQLIMGETLAQRTIDKLDLDIDAAELRKNVKATAKVNTVLIDVAVVDESPVRARDIADALSDEFVVMVRELETPPDRRQPDARVIVEQRASIPDHPVTPRTTRNLGIGLGIGLLLGVGLAFLRDQMDNTVKSRAVLEDITGVGLVGSIPLDKERRKTPAIAFDNDNSAIAEAFRKIRTNLHFLAVDNPPRVIVVTSSFPNEGKSTTAINIALALAEAEHDVVLVEGDLRRPRLNSYLGLVGSVGYSTVLTGQTSLDEVLQKTQFPRLSVLTSGGLPPNPSELLGSLAAKNVLDQLRERFDYVVIDSSPLLAVTDAAILAANSDGVLMIARYGETKREHLAQAIGNLNNVGAPLLGAIFTMMPTRGHAGYSSRYGYYGDGQSSTPPPDADPGKGASTRRRRAKSTSRYADRLFGRKRS